MFLILLKTATSRDLDFKLFRSLASQTLRITFGDDVNKLDPFPLAPFQPFFISVISALEQNRHMRQCVLFAPCACASNLADRAGKTNHYIYGN